MVFVFDVAFELEVVKGSVAKMLLEIEVPLLDILVLLPLMPPMIAKRAAPATEKMASSAASGSSMSNG